MTQTRVADISPPRQGRGAKPCTRPTLRTTAMYCAGLPEKGPVLASFPARTRMAAQPHAESLSW